MSLRKEDSPNKTFFRTDRFFAQGNQWYFQTREGTTEGPYGSREEAEQELVLYLRGLDERAKFGLLPEKTSPTTEP